MDTEKAKIFDEFSSLETFRVLEDSAVIGEIKAKGFYHIVGLLYAERKRYRITVFALLVSTEEIPCEAGCYAFSP